ncbi:hypothetical protein ACSL103130_07765 [Actinomyces slackii]|uniref:DUF8094 domain-containing protein n=1 Tax=Actinomyces slackii TaxID=52774 RepID=A0A448KCR7_9ACTO|nr:hypothetical protein [Actinomyces slackii]VEG74711.1 Uncharacterised protein [Actinomyces slackii]
MTSRRAFLAGGTASALAMTLAACSQEKAPTTPTVTESAAPQSALTPEKLAEVLKRIKTGMDAADAKKDPELLKGFLENPAARFRQAEYALATATKEDSHIQVLPATTSQTSSAGVTLDFPRVAINVTEEPSENVAPFLMTMRQNTARDNFQLWAWVQLFPGAEVPPIDNLLQGSKQVVADTEGLVATPQAVLESYIDALNNPDGENGKAFADDQLRQQVAAQRGVDFGGLGEVKVTAAAGSDGLLGLHVADGGAIAVTTLTYTVVFKRTVDGATLNVHSDIGALLGENTAVVGTVTATYEAMVAFFIPVQGGDGKAVALGADTVLAKVERDDNQTPAPTATPTG